MMLDCRSLEFELLPLPDRDTGGDLQLDGEAWTFGGEYGDRRGEVEAGQAVLQKERRGSSCCGTLR